jgi:hypothetical protein
VKKRRGGGNIGFAGSKRGSKIDFVNKKEEDYYA